MRKSKSIIMLCSLILMLSFINIISLTLYPNTLSNIFISNTSVSALSYQSKVGVGFTLNPSLSISMSSNDLVIPDLVAGSYDDSNSINVLVSSNTLSGYTVSVNTNNEEMESSSSHAFTSLDVDADLSDLSTADDNTWGYSYSLDNGSTWSNYSGLSINSNKTLYDTTSPADNKTLGFKIGAKASVDQPSGVYSATLNFIAVSKPSPIIIADMEYLQDFASLNETDLESVKNSMVLNYGYILKDIRDEKEYYIARLEDGNVWMTQNLDLDIGGAGVTTFTSENTDINTTASGTGIYSSGYTLDNGVWTWVPDSTAITSSRIINYSNNTVSNWGNGSNIAPYSAEGGDTYFYTSNSDADDIKYTSLSQCTNAGHTEGDCKHYHVGNYYNWTAAIASNDSTDISTNYDVAANSVCPKGWRLPAINNNESNTFWDLLRTYSISNGYSFSDGGFAILRTNPLFFVRSGSIRTNIYQPGHAGYYASSIIKDANSNYAMFMRTPSDNTGFAIDGQNPTLRSYGLSIRCLVR